MVSYIFPRLSIFPGQRSQNWKINLWLVKIFNFPQRVPFIIYATLQYHSYYDQETQSKKEYLGQKKLLNLGRYYLCCMLIIPSFSFQWFEKFNIRGEKIQLSCHVFWIWLWAPIKGFSYAWIVLAFCGPTGDGYCSVKSISSW